MRSSTFLVPAVVACLLLSPRGAEAQSIASGTVSGVVTDQAGIGMPRASITLRAVDYGLLRRTETDGSGDFQFTFVTPGTYELRIEALGALPLVVTPLTIGPGATRVLELVLNAAVPPVITADTLRPDGGGAASRWRQGGVWLGERLAQSVPSRLEDTGALANLTSISDGALGVEGLPGVMSREYVDGVPFYRAAHPRRRGEPLGPPVLPRGAVSLYGVVPAAPDIEGSGSAGADLFATTQVGVPGGIEAGGGWSGAPLWSSSQIDVDSPTLSSLWGSFRGAVAISPDTSRIYVVADGYQSETPLAARLSSADGLAGLDSELVAPLAASSVLRERRLSALSRIDWWSSQGYRLFVRAAAGRLEREADGLGPEFVPYGGASSEETTEFSLAGGLVSQVARTATLELRAGVSGSDRTFGGVASEAEIAHTRLVDSGANLGMPEWGAAEASRIDVFATPVLHAPVGLGSVKVGGIARTTSHTIGLGHQRNAVFTYADGGALGAGDGWLEAPTRAVTTFSSGEIGAFAQYQWQAAPGLRFTVGARYDYETLRDITVQSDEDWFFASGLYNGLYPESFSQIGGHTSVEWDVGGRGTTSFFATFAVHHGDLDPSVVADYISQDGSASVRRASGAGLEWPDASVPTGTTSAPIALLGPDMRPPQTARVNAGITQRLAPGWSMHLSGTLRRTDFLARRRNLNLPLRAVGETANGQDLFGTLEKSGSVVRAEEGTNRRFGDFDDIWAFDPDGWSEYRGATMGLEYQGDGAHLFASYTRSETTDNWLGAREGLPDAELSPQLPEDGVEWAEGTSDFDIPDQLVVGGSLDLGLPLGGTVAASYRFRSGLPFTPGYRAGVDANGDGSALNDVAFVPTDLGELAGETCLASQAGDFAIRNGCRAPARHSLDASISVGIARVGSRVVEVTVQGFNLVESESGLVDQALLLIDPTADLGTVAGSDAVTLPVTLNPDFGSVVFPFSPGRILRIGIRVGGGR